MQHRQTANSDNMVADLKITVLFRAVVFDLDGTLTDTEHVFQESWKKAVSEFGYHLKPEMGLLLRSLGHPYVNNQFKQWFGEDCDYLSIKKLCHRYFQIATEQKGIVLKPGAQQLLSKLKEKNMTIALATSGNLERVVGCLERTNIIQYFDTLICADMVERGKPAPDTYLYACRQLGLEPENVLAIEDSPNGVKSAYAAGCKVIMVPDLTEPDDELLSMLFKCADSLDAIIGCIG